ncbi:hypothetical protein HJFPF1_08117 [Paramyrothecium foliicola]|nr:hypothetical protein HJFPF1_08117 [Paramyrothecium foliicola]
MEIKGPHLDAATRRLEYRATGHCILFLLLFRRLTVNVEFYLLMTTYQFRSYTDSLNNPGGSLAPPSIPPPPPPPPPLNIPPSRARLQLAARLAMHQKNNQSSQASSANLHNDDADDDALDPFADADDDDVDVDDDDDGSRGDNRGAWWRGVLSKDGGDSEDDDDEFGDFAMAEGDKTGDNAGDNVVLKPLAVNPAKENTRTLSGLWPFGAKKDRNPHSNDDDDDDLGPRNDVVVPATGAVDEKLEGHPVEVKEAKSRTSIEDPDDDDDYGAELLAGTKA